MAVRSLDARWNKLQVVEIEEGLTHRAGKLTSDHSLRAADAIHLASAEVLVEELNREVVFACWDVRLWEAARTLGFGLAPRDW